MGRRCAPVPGEIAGAAGVMPAVALRAQPSSPTSVGSGRPGGISSSGVSGSAGICGVSVSSKSFECARTGDDADGENEVMVGSSWRSGVDDDVGPAATCAAFCGQGLRVAAREHGKAGTLRVVSLAVRCSFREVVLQHRPRQPSPRRERWRSAQVHRRNGRSHRGHWLRKVAVPSPNAPGNSMTSRIFGERIRKMTVYVVLLSAHSLHLITPCPTPPPTTPALPPRSSG